VIPTASRRSRSVFFRLSTNIATRGQRRVLAYFMVARAGRSSGASFRGVGLPFSLKRPVPFEKVDKGLISGAAGELERRLGLVVPGVHIGPGGDEGFGRCQAAV